MVFFVPLEVLMPQAPPCCRLTAARPVAPVSRRARLPGTPPHGPLLPVGLCPTVGDDGRVQHLITRIRHATYVSPVVLHAGLKRPRFLCFGIEAVCRLCGTFFCPWCATLLARDLCAGTVQMDWSAHARVHDRVILVSSSASPAPPRFRLASLALRRGSSHFAIYPGFRLSYSF